MGNWFVAVLQLIFVVAKLTNTVAWSWFVVFLPLIISTGLFVVILALAVGIMCLTGASLHFTRKK